MWKSSYGGAAPAEGDYLAPASVPGSANGSEYRINPSLLAKATKKSPKKVNNTNDDEEGSEYMNPSNMSSRSIATELEEEEDYMFPGTISSASSFKGGNNMFQEDEYMQPGSSVGTQSYRGDQDYMMPPSMGSGSQSVLQNTNTPPRSPRLNNDSNYMQPGSNGNGYMEPGVLMSMGGSRMDVEGSEVMYPSSRGGSSVPAKGSPSANIHGQFGAYAQPKGDSKMFGVYSSGDAYAEVDSEVLLGSEEKAALNEIKMPEYDEKIPYKHLIRATVTPMREQATPIGKPLTPEVLPPKAPYVLWKDMTDILHRKESGLLSSWSRKTATLTRQSISLYKDSRKDQRLQPEVIIRVQDIKAVRDVESGKYKDKQSTAFVLVAAEGEFIFNAESAKAKELWKKKIYTAILLLCVHGGLGERMFQEALKSGIDPNIAESKDKIPALATAIENDRRGIVKALFKKGAHPQYLVHKLFISKVGFSRVFQCMIENESDLNVRGVDSYEGTMLHHACEARDVNAVKKMLQCRPKVNLNIRNGDGDTPLLIAIKSENATIAELLIKAGADVNLMDKRHNFPIHLALYRGQRDLVTLLERHGCDINVLDERGYTPLHIAVIKGMTVSALFLLTQGANVKAKTQDGEIALHIALRKGKKMRVVSALLVHKGSPLDATDSFGNNAYHLALMNEFWDIALYISAIDRNPSFGANKAGETPLLLACRKNKKQLVFQYLDSGANPNQVSSVGETPLHVFLTSYEFNVEDECNSSYNLRASIEKFIFKNADFRLLTTDTGESPLHVAVRRCLLTAVDIFIQLDPESIDLTTKKGCSSLHLACESKGGEESFSLAIASLLLGAGARTDLTNAAGDTPLHSAVTSDNKAIVNILLNFHAEPYHWDKKGYCPIHCAVQQGSVDLVEEFVATGTNLNVWTEGGFTPIALAVECGHLAVVSTLVRNGSSLSIRLPDSHNTAMHTAVEKGRGDIVKELLKGDVSVHTVVNKRGETPITICERKIREQAGRGVLYDNIYETLKNAPVVVPVKSDTLKRRMLRSQKNRVDASNLAVSNPMVKRLSDAAACGTPPEALKAHYESNVKTRHEQIVEEQTRTREMYMQFPSSPAVTVANSSMNSAHSEADNRSDYEEVGESTYTENSKFHSRAPSNSSVVSGRSARSTEQPTGDALEAWLDQHGVTGSVREKIIKDSKTLNSLLSTTEDFMATARADAKKGSVPSNVFLSKTFTNIRNILVIASRLEKLLFKPTGTEIAGAMVANVEELITICGNKRICQQSSYPPFTQKTLDLIKSSISHQQFKFWTTLGIQWNSATG
eukprot:Nk52_evm19s292 gene=Nk52_evmTU19s292